MPNAVAYSKNKEKIINYYILQSKNNNNNTVFVVSVTEDKGKILDITQVSDASLIKELINMSN